jgi:4-amino-4-deoxy-L-arabinose transferase-like glycosyltransferase
MSSIIKTASLQRAESEAIYREYAGTEVLALAAVCLVNFFFALSCPALFDIDEGMHAAMAKTMVLTGDWVTPVFNGEPFFDKPALSNWLVAASFVVFGFTDFAARFPSALMGTGCVFLTFAIGRRFFGRNAGFLAALTLATSLLLIILSRMVVYDVTFTFFTTLSLYFICDALFGSRRKSAFLAFHASVALAVLTKGLLGLAVPGLAIAVLLLWSRDLARIREFRLVGGAMIIAVIVTPWYVMMELANPGYLDYFIVNQHLGNLLGNAGQSVARHPQPFFYYIPVLLLGLFPWSFLLPAALHGAWALRKQEAQLPTVFLLSWLVAGFLLFSYATSKLSTYILPLFPAAALLLGKYIAGILEAPQKRAWHLTTGLGAAATVILIPAFWVIANDGPEKLLEEDGFAWFDIRITVIVPTILTVLAFWFAWRNRPVLATAITATVAPLFFLIVWGLLMPDAFAFRSSAQIAAKYESLVPADQDLVFSDKMFDAAVYYIGRDARILRGRDELHDYLRQDQRVYVLARTDSDSLVDCAPDLAYVVFTVGNKQILSNVADNPVGEGLPMLPEVQCRDSRNGERLRRPEKGTKKVPDLFLRISPEK